MQTIKIEDNLYQKLIEAGIDIQAELKKLVTKKIFKLTHSEIKQVVENSQRIEGYEPVSQDIKDRVRLLMKKHNVKVSL